MTLCHCGQPLHYSDPAIQHTVEDLVRSLGEYTVIMIPGGRRFRVQRHYIALHGLTAAELPFLGFEELQ